MGKETEIELNEENKDKLTALILERFNRAAANKSDEFYRGKSIDTWDEELTKRFALNYDKDYAVDLVRIKSTVLHSKVQDMVVNSLDAPFVVSPTPIPTLSKEQTESVQLDVEKELGKKLLESGIVIVDENGQVFPNFNAIIEKDMRIIPEAREWLQAEAKKQKKTTEFKALQIATSAAEKVTKLMQDQLVQGDWRTAYLDFFRDFALKGTGCIRQELKQVSSLKWVDNKLKEHVDTRLTWRHVPYSNCFPSPDSEDANSGTYFIERAAMLKQDLFACADIDWIDNKKVEEAYEKALKNPTWLNNTNGETYWNDDDYIDVIIHEGTVKGDVILDYIDDDSIKKHHFYDIEAVVVANVCIGMRVIEYLKGSRSYYSASYMSKGNSFWGLGIGMLLADSEDRINSYIQRLDKNVGISTNPPVFYDSNQFEHVKDIKLEAGTLIPFSVDPVTGQNGRPPFYQVNFNSYSGELINLFNFFYRLTDDISGIPALLSGNSQQFGGESTFRGMKMLASSANTIVKSSFMNIDKTVIQPLIENLWRWNMLNSDDDSIKADVQIVARGAAGLMQKEIADAERTEMIPIISNLLQGAGLDEQTTQQIIQTLLYQTMQSGGLPADKLMNNPESAQEMNAFQSGIPQSLNPATPEPTIGKMNNIGGLSV